MTSVAAVLAAMTAAYVDTAYAQNASNPPTPSCTFAPAAFSAADACQKGIDVFAFVSPQIALAVAGGNPIPSEAGSLGGAGARSLSLRAVVVEGFVPRKTVSIGAGAAIGSDFGAARVPLPLPAADVAIGLFAGLPAGVTHVGGVDLLLGATYLPDASREGFSIDPAKRFGFAYGARVGVLQESGLVPGLGVSWMRRRLPTTTFAYATADDSISVSDTRVRSDGVRVVMSKRLALLGLAVGVGRDAIETSAHIEAVVNDGAVSGRACLTGLRETMRRDNAFANLSYGIALVRIVGEVGYSRVGATRTTINQFGNRRANEGYRYGSIGITTRF